MITLELLAKEAVTIFQQSFIAFCVAMALIPIYKSIAHHHKLWKKKRLTSTTGEALNVVAMLSTRKRNVPTMAGLIVIIATTIVTLLFNLDTTYTWLPLIILLGSGAVGLIDDIINVKGKGEGVAGLSATLKLTLVTLIAAFGAWFFYYKLGYTTMHLPFSGELSLGWLLIPIFIFIVISTGNAVNISDGRDGLAGGLLMSAYTAFGIIAALQGNVAIAAFCLTVAGALLAYLWFNIAPAAFFMGDVGSFALGTTLAVVAMLTDTVLLLPIIGIVFVIEGGSSFIQILSKKLFHRKIFIAAPVHHHFEAIGWEKTQLTMRYWVIGQVGAAVGLIVAVTGGFIR